MRKLLVSSFVSLDGVVESPMTWSSRFFDDECREYAYRKLGDVEFFLLGRKAYEAFVPAWPAITGNAYIDRINGLKKLVASTTLDEVRWNASLLKGDVAKALAAVRTCAGAQACRMGENGALSDGVRRIPERPPAGGDSPRAKRPNS
jgi:hypothetical protein